MISFSPIYCIHFIMHPCWDNVIDPKKEICRLKKNWLFMIMVLGCLNIISSSSMFSSFHQFITNPTEEAINKSLPGMKKVCVIILQLHKNINFVFCILQAIKIADLNVTSYLLFVLALYINYLPLVINK